MGVELVPHQSIDHIEIRIELGWVDSRSDRDDHLVGDRAQVLEDVCDLSRRLDGEAADRQCRSSAEHRRSLVVDPECPSADVDSYGKLRPMGFSLGFDRPMTGRRPERPGQPCAVGRSHGSRRRAVLRVLATAGLAAGAAACGTSDDLRAVSSQTSLPEQTVSEETRPRFSAAGVARTRFRTAGIAASAAIAAREAPPRILPVAGDPIPPNVLIFTRLKRR